MNVKRFALIVAILAINALGLTAKNNVNDGVSLRDAQVSRVQTRFKINYDVTLGNNVRSCTIRLLMSTDGGKTFECVNNNLLSGDIGKVTTSGHKEITYDFSSIKEKLADKPLRFKVDIATKDVFKRETLISAQVAVYPHLSYGIMFGMVKQWGWYIKARSDFSFPKSSYDVNTTDGNFWGTGNKKISRYNFTGGAMCRATKWLYPYLGLGYGHYGLYWEDVNGKWAKVKDYSTSGISLDAGLAFKIGKFSINAGVSNTMFKYTEAEIGIGVMF